MTYVVRSKEMPSKVKSPRCSTCAMDGVQAQESSVVIAAYGIMV